MDDRVHYHAYRAKQLAGQAAVVADRILVETHFLAELLGIERPALDIPGIAAVSAELRQSGEFLRHRQLHVVPRYAFVIRRGFIIDERALRKIRGRHHHPPRALTVGSSSLVVS